MKQSLARPRDRLLLMHLIPARPCNSAELTADIASAIHTSCFPFLPLPKDLPWVRPFLLESINRNYRFPVNIKMPLITVLVAPEINCDTNPRSTPNCEPSRGRTIINPIRIIKP